MKLKDITWVLIILLFISGCKGRKEYSPTITSKEVYSGKEGLSIEFFENSPPDEIFEKSVLPIGLRLFNGGAYDIKRGYLSIGLEKDYMWLDEASLRSINDMVDFRDSEHIQFDLKGKSLQRPQGEHEVITFGAVTKELGKLDPQSEYHDVLVSITACYGYQTKAVETVCIDTDVYGFKVREKACDVETLKLDSQGAPVAVTNIESEMLPSIDVPNLMKPRFVITVKNVGEGEVVKRNMVEAACSSEPIGYKEWNNINIKVYLSTIEDRNKLDCDVTKEGGYDDGILILKGGQDTIRCTYEEGFKDTKGAFSSPLYIILDYGYTNTLSREVRVKKVITH